MNQPGKRWRVPEGYIYVLEDICKGCSFCIEYCPRAVLVRSDRFNAKGYHSPVVVDADACVMCGFCELVCPDFAIWTQQEPVASATVGSDEAATVPDRAAGQGDA
jgi:2-oxoglutarate ferredoxin oxidoreductase subunit delta